MLNRKGCSIALVLVSTLISSNTFAQSAITTPLEQFGFNLGDDHQIASYTQLEGYWQRLARGIRPHVAGGDRDDGRGPPDLYGDYHRCREPREPRSVQGHIASSGPGRKCLRGGRRGSSPQRDVPSSGLTEDSMRPRCSELSN